MVVWAGGLCGRDWLVELVRDLANGKGKAANDHRAVDRPYKSCWGDEAEGSRSCKRRLAHGSTYTSDMDPLEVVEDKPTIPDLIKASQEGRLLGAFAVGTACFVVPVAQINYKGQEIDVPEDVVSHVSALRQWMPDILLYSLR
ncbi:hypothetical protein BDW75DRAFT_242937 [Aspergillus navahoensis]